MAAKATLSLNSTTIKEGGLATGTVTLSEASSLATSIQLSIKTNGPGSVSNSSAFVTIPAGQKSYQFKLPAYDDSITGNGIFEVSGIATVDGNAQFLTAVKGTITDNDINGWIINATDAKAAYKAVTQVSEITWQDELKLIDFMLSDYTSRDLIKKMADYGNTTTSVALTTYQFFTGSIPNAGGLKFLVNSSDNANDLTDVKGMYANFGLENRYINFASNLGLQGDGKAAFAANYGGLTFAQAVDKAYDTIIGKSFATTAGLNVSAAIADITGREGYFKQVAAERMAGFDQGLAAKAGLVGYIIAEAIKADVGIYARGVENFYLDAADGTAKYGVDLVGTYGPGTFVDGI